MTSRLHRQTKKIPFEKSFASHPKSQFWHPTLNGDIKPRDVTKFSNKILSFEIHK